MGFFEGLVGQIKGILNGLTNGQKLVLLSMVGAFITLTRKELSTGI